MHRDMATSLVAERPRYLVICALLHLVVLAVPPHKVRVVRAVLGFVLASQLGELFLHAESVQGLYSIGPTFQAASAHEIQQHKVLTSNACANFAKRWRCFVNLELNIRALLLLVCKPDSQGQTT